MMKKLIYKASMSLNIDGNQTCQRTVKLSIAKPLLNGLREKVIIRCIISLKKSYKQCLLVKNRRMMDMIKFIVGLCSSISTQLLIKFHINQSNRICRKRVLNLKFTLLLKGGTSISDVMMHNFIQQ